MDESSSDSESLHARIQELKQERDALHKDIEQLCMQKAGPKYVNYATQTYFRRTAGLEQEVENLKKKLADSAKENSDVKDELSEAKRIKTYLDQLHKLEVSKNTEVVKQLEYLRGVIAKAFSDRDNSLMEAEKAKEIEELMLQKLNDTEMRLQEISEGSTETQEQVINLQLKLEKQEQEIENYRKVINKFYSIWEHAGKDDGDEESRTDQFDDVSWDEKCACLDYDPTESWSFNAPRESSANYVAAVQEELEILRASVDDLQNKLQMGLEIENHLKRRVSTLEQKKILSHKLIVDGISSLREYHCQQMTHIMDLLNDERSYLQSVVGSIEQKIGNLHTDIHPAEEAGSSMPKLDLTADSSEALRRALQEKVSALVLLSQQEERHIWEKSVHVAVQETVDELQSFLKLASEQKVNALVELAELKQQYQFLLEKTLHESPQGSRVAASGGSSSFRSLLKKTSKIFGTEDTQLVLYPKLQAEGSLNGQRSNNGMDANARLRVEFANLKDSMHSLERLISDIRKLRVSLIQAKMTASSKGNSKQLDETIREGELLKIALSSALPLSWSEGEASSSGSGSGSAGNPDKGSNADKIDPVSAAGLEMVELLILAAQIMKEKSKRISGQSE